MEDFRLKVFRSVATHGSLTKASHELRITQPVISKYIQELEQEYQLTLFNRNGRGVELTQAGELMLSHVDNILQLYSKMDCDLRTMSHIYCGKLRLGATATIAQYLLPAFMASFTTKFKQVELSLVEGDTHAIEKAVEERRVDIGLLECCRRKSQFRYQPFMHDELVPVTSSQSQWSRCDVITIDDMKNVPLIISNAEYEYKKALEVDGMKQTLPLSQLNVALTMDSAESIKRYILHSDFVALLPLQTVVPELRMGMLKILEIDNLCIEREYVIIRNLEETTSLVQDFINYMQQGL